MQLKTCLTYSPFIIISPHAKNPVHVYKVLYGIYMTIPLFLNYWGSGLW
jgi:hypothetical protein